MSIGEKALQQTLQQLSVNAGPRDAAWIERLKEEYTALIAYQQMTKANGDDWVEIEAVDDLGTKWKGTCSYVHEFLKYEFALEFEIPATYPATPIELVLPQLDGKTLKMYQVSCGWCATLRCVPTRTRTHAPNTPQHTQHTQGAKICLDIHFKPLWSKNAPKFGIAHALALGLGPWLSVEIPQMIASQLIQHESLQSSSGDSCANAGNENECGDR